MRVAAMESLLARRSVDRMPDGVWNATVNRVRAEFEEMPCLRVTADQARLLFGLPEREARRILGCLEQDGFLGRTPRGEYQRRDTRP
jgi:hypothetical protein